MRLTIKTLDQRTFVVEFDESRTIGDLKAHLCKLPDIAVQPELQHLIYAGRVLSNENSLKSYSIDERKFLVMMAKKNGAAEAAPPPPAAAQKSTTDESAKLPAAVEQPKAVATAAAATTEVASSAAAAAAASASSGTAAAASATSGKTEQQNSPKSAAAAATEKKQPEKAEPEAAAAAAAAAAPTSQAATDSGSSSTAPLLAQAANMAPSIHPNDSLVRDIVSMGYAEDEVRRALAASYNNPDRAIEYLIDGIPNLPEMPVASGLSAAPPQQRAGQSATAAAAAAAAAAGENPLSFLRDDPRFSQMRQIIRLNPELLGSVLTKIGESNPELLTIIRQHQEEFVRMLNEGDVGHSGGGGGGSGSGGGSGGAADDDDDDEGGNQHVVRIMLTAAERQAVDRLVSLGFTRDMVLQAYIACEKNEEQTADFLFQQMDENQ